VLKETKIDRLSISYIDGSASNRDSVENDGQSNIDGVQGNI
jgi:hypothetical protein